MKNFKRPFWSFLTILSLGVVMISCSGGGGSGNDDNNNQAQPVSLFSPSASCTDSDSSDCNSSLNGGTAHFFLIPSSTAVSSIDLCQSLAGFVTSGNFDPSFSAKTTADISCNTESTTGCGTNNVEPWKNATNEFLTELDSGDYSLFIAFSQDSNTYTPSANDVFLCKNLGLDESVGDDLELIGSNDLQDVVWSFGSSPDMTVSCTDSDDSDCDASHDGSVAETFVFAGETCSSLQGQIENGLITTHPAFSSATVSGCGSVEESDVCSYGVDFDEWSYGDHGSSEGGGPLSILAGDYAFLSFFGADFIESISSSPNNNHLVFCKEVTIDEDPPLETSAVSIDGTNILNIAWPNLVTIPDVDFSCTSLETEDCDPFLFGADESGVPVLSGWIKDKTCSQIVTDIGNGLSDALDFHANGSSSVNCELDGDSTEEDVWNCDASIDSWVDAGEVSTTEIVEGSYALVGIFDALNDLEQVGPAPKDLAYCKEVNLAAPTQSFANPISSSPEMSEELDDDDIQSVSYNVAFAPNVSASCTSGNNANCTFGKDGKYTYFLLFYDQTCSGLLTGDSELLATNGTDNTSCSSSSETDSCTSSRTSFDWYQESDDDLVSTKSLAKSSSSFSTDFSTEDSDPYFYVPKGVPIALAAVLYDTATSPDFPGGNDVMWCRDFSSYSGGDFDLDDNDLLSPPAGDLLKKKIAQSPGAPWNK